MNHTITSLKEAQKSIGKGYTNITFIMDYYKTSTLPRLFYDFNLSVKDIDDSVVITKYLKSAKALKSGLTQDELFDIICKTDLVEPKYRTIFTPLKKNNYEKHNQNQRQGNLHN